MEEKESINFKKIASAFSVFILIWGSLWTGQQGYRIVKDKKIFNDNLFAGAIEAFKINRENYSIATSTIDTNSANKLATSISTTSKDTLKIIVGGDVMMDRAVRNLGQKYGYDSLFESVKPLFEKADIVAINLEGPITSNKSKTLTDDGRTTKLLTFTFDPIVTTALSKAGIDVVSLANNHIDNFGQAGIVETKQFLNKSNIKWFGDYRNSSSTETTIEKNGFSITFVGYHAFQPGFDKIVAKIKELTEQGHFVIVMPHWGQEYATSSNASMRNQARSLVAAGAKAILGSHPHVILEHHTIGDVPVFYSLGNLLFDQYFSQAVMNGNLIELNLIKNNDQTTIDGIKIYKTSLTSNKTIELDTEPLDF